MYIPGYLMAIQSDINAAQKAVERMSEKIEASTEYNDHLHPFHAAAVSTFNSLVSIAIQLDKYEMETTGILPF